MLAASQDIDNFIERQRSQLNKQGARQASTRQPPPQAQRSAGPALAPSLPPQPSQSFAPNNVQDRLDFRVARILDEPAPRVPAPPSSQPYYPPSSPPMAGNFFPDQQVPYHPEQENYRRLSNDNNGDNSLAFFNKFGTYEDKRSQLKDDLKREYNEYLQAQKRVPKSKSTSQLTSPRANNGNNNRRVQFPSNGKVVAPWEKGDQKSNNNPQSMQDLSTRNVDFSSNRSRPQVVRNQDETYVRDREEYISELHAQIRELEARKQQLESQSTKFSTGGPSTVARTHHTEDLNALNSLLAERIDQRNAMDFELAHILNRPPISSSPTRLGSGNMPPLNMPMDQSYQNSSNQRYPPPANGRQGQPQRNDRRTTKSNDNGFQIGQELDKDSEQAAKKRYQQELQAQMREAQMRKADAKREKDEYDRKLDAEIQRYNYFGRSGGGAPMRDKEGNVVANLADLRNPPQSNQGPPQSNQGSSQYVPPNEKIYSLGSGTSSITNAPFYNGEQQQSSFPGTTDRSGSPPSHVRGAVSNGIFGAAKTEDQLQREERYKQDLKKQIDEKRQRELDEVARRRAEEEREMAKHLQWQQQMERQAAEDAAKKQEKEAQDRVHNQQLHEDLERQRQQEDIAARRKPKRVEKPMTPKREEADDQDYRDNNQDDADRQAPPPPPPAETAYRSSSPPIPAIKNKGKKAKPKNPPVKRPSYDDDAMQGTSPPPPLPPITTDEDFGEPPPVDDVRASHGQQTYRKPPAPRQPDVSSARKKPPPSYQNRARPSSNTGMPPRTNSNLSLRSDGSDSEVLNRLEHLKRQLKDKEARLQEHVIRHQTDTNSSSHTNEQPKTTYQPPMPRKQSPGFLMNAARLHHRDSPTNNDRTRRMLQTDDDFEFKPSYFRDDTILMSGVAPGPTTRDYPPHKRIDSADRLFGDNIEREASRRRYGGEPSNYYDRDDPTMMANHELNRIAQQNEQRLKKLRDLENDDASLLDSNEVLERFQQKQRLQRGGSQTTLQDDAWFK